MAARKIFSDIIEVMQLSKELIRNLLSRFGVGFIFITIGLWELIQPEYWSSFVPKFMASILDPIFLVRGHGAVLLLLGLGILVGFYLRQLSIIGCLIMAEIILSLLLTLGFNDIAVRDITIFFFVATLAFI